jgi:hypothetical protein
MLDASLFVPYAAGADRHVLTNVVAASPRVTYWRKDLALDAGMALIIATMLNDWLRRYANAGTLRANIVINSYFFWIGCLAISPENASRLDFNPVPRHDRDAGIPNVSPSGELIAQYGMIGIQTQGIDGDGRPYRSGRNDHWVRIRGRTTTEQDKSH